MEQGFEQQRYLSEIDAAKIAAREAMLHFAHAGLAYLRGETAQFDIWQTTARQSAFADLAGMERGSHAARARVIADNLVWSNDQVAGSGLDTERQNKVRAFAQERILQMTSTNSGFNAELIEARKRRQTKIADTENNGRYKSRDALQRSFEMLADSTVMTLSFNLLESKLAERTQRTKSVIAERESVLGTVIVAEIESYSGVITAKGVRIDSLAESFRRALTEKINVHLRQQANEQASASRNTGGQHNRSSGQNDGAGSGRQQQATGTERPATDRRLQRIMADTSGTQQACVTVLANIDHHRQKGREDVEIYRLLARHFHPDRSDSEGAEEVFKVTSAMYDSTAKRFNI